MVLDEFIKEFQSALPLRGATIVRCILAHGVQFQSALPLRGATGMSVEQVNQFVISIRAPLAGSD